MVFDTPGEFSYQLKITVYKILWRSYQKCKKKSFLINFNNYTSYTFAVTNGFIFYWIEREENNRAVTLADAKLYYDLNFPLKFKRILALWS